MKIKFLKLLSLIMIIGISGCAKQPEVKITENTDDNTSIKVETIEEVTRNNENSSLDIVTVAEYEERKSKAFCSDYRELKKAVAILIKRANEVSNGSINNSSTDMQVVSSLNGDELDDIKKELKHLREELQQVKSNNKRSAPGTISANTNIMSDKEVVRKYCRNITIVNIDPTQTYKAKHNTYVRPCPNKASKPLRLIKVGTVVKYKGCDIYGWCELEDESGFVAGYVFRKVK